MILTCFVQEAAEQLQEETGIPVVSIRCPRANFVDEDWYAALRLTAELTGTEERCEELLGYMDACKSDLKGRSSAVADPDKPTVYAGAVTFSGGHGFAGTYANFGPFLALGARNVAAETGEEVAFEVDLEKVLVWDPDVIFLDPGNINLVNDEYRSNPAYFHSLTAVRKGEAYTMHSFNNYSTNITYCLMNAYHAGKVLYPDPFADVDLEAKSQEIMTEFLGIVFLSISTGSSGLTAGETFAALLGRGTQQSHAVVRNIRMPRIATGMVVGAALALAGCVMQNVLRNPLASASTLGVSQGASFGAAVAIVCLDAGTQVNASHSAVAVSIANPYLVTLCAFAGGFLTTAVILGLSRVAKVTPATMVLAGVALSSLFSGGTTMVQYFADDVKVASVVYWTFGDLGRANWREIGLIFSITAGSMLFFLANRWNFNALESGTETAKSLGVPVDRLILASMTLCSLMAAVSTVFVGCISFIGLIAPHIVRRFVGNDHRFLIPASALTAP